MRTKSINLKNVLKKEDSLSIGWNDGGMVHGSFSFSLSNFILNKNIHGIEINNLYRVSGNSGQLAKNRSDLFNLWYDENKTDWFLCIDSDIVFTHDHIKALWDAKDKDNFPVLSGLYFISINSELLAPEPKAAIFKYDKEANQMYTFNYIKPNTLIDIDAAGLGFLLIHRSVITKLREKNKTKYIFQDEYKNDIFVGEDIFFFTKIKELNIPIYCHTGASVKHVKSFPLDAEYSNVYWTKVFN
jgi:hypothetical protein